MYGNPSKIMTEYINCSHCNHDNRLKLSGYRCNECNGFYSFGFDNTGQVCESCGRLANGNDKYPNDKNNIPTNATYLSCDDHKKHILSHGGRTWKCYILRGNW